MKLALHNPTKRGDSVAARKGSPAVKPRVNRFPWLAPAGFCLFFFLTAVVLIPLPGLQHDELFFSSPIYYPETAFYRISIAAHKIPLMVISYTGALKTWLYAGIFAILEPDVWSVRVPVALMGICTIVLTWVWVRRIAGSRAALIGTALLATDTMFLLTDIFDWGPVALQHVLLMGGLVLVQRWIAEGSMAALGFGFLLWGLGVWDKALLMWPLMGLMTACLLIYPRTTVGRIRRGPALIACAAFLLGAMPLIVYNVQKRGETATANVRLTTAELPIKAAGLRGTINGSALFGFMLNGNPQPVPRRPETSLGRISAAISKAAGPHRTNWMIPAWIAGLACFAALWRTGWRKPASFLLVAVAVTWLQMAFTRDAGYGAHHAILLWPFPSAFLGIVYAGAAERLPPVGRRAGAGAVVLILLSNVLTTNQYLAEFESRGATGGWTDAIYPLCDTVDERTPGWVGVVDWGYLNGLTLCHEGRLHIFAVSAEVGPNEVKRMVSVGNVLMIQHTADKQMHPGINERLRAAALSLGYEERLASTVSDTHGRPVFELFRFQKSR